MDSEIEGMIERITIRVQDHNKQKQKYCVNCCSKVSNKNYLLCDTCIKKSKYLKKLSHVCTACKKVKLPEYCIGKKCHRCLGFYKIKHYLLDRQRLQIKKKSEVN